MVFMGHIRSIVGSALLSSLLYGSGLLTILSPLPIILMRVNRGRLGGAVAAALALAVLLLIRSLSLHTSEMLPLLKNPFAAAFSPGAALSLSGLHYLFYLIVGLSAGECLARRRGSAAAIWTGLVSGLAFGAMAFVLAQYAFGWQLIQAVKELFTTTMADLASQSQLALPSEAIVEVALRILPALFFSFTLLASALNASLAQRISWFEKVRGLKPGMAELVGQEGFRLSDHLVWLLIGSWGLFFADVYYIHHPLLGALAINVLLMLAALYFLQGFSVVLELLKRIRAPFLRMLLFVGMVFFFQIASLLIVGLGVADIWLNMRTRSKSAKGDL